MDEYQEWEELRREAAEAKDRAVVGSVWYIIWSWVLRQIEQAQKEIINERYKR